MKDNILHVHLIKRPGLRCINGKHCMNMSYDWKLPNQDTRWRLSVWSYLKDQEAENAFIIICCTISRVIDVEDEASGAGVDVLATQLNAEEDSSTVARLAFSG
eukprot:TRINITY_DN8534_c1_g2_i3.p2 TRINITY_DN8534_c1_g2~~TRINITY_DN8534_c1_g2_i3.p2  ORF type:complete len:103 (+),score=17.15 TRINITY_DN8534_c1_g2_i3:2101-2409(+)